MDCAAYLASLSFTFLQPGEGRHDGWYRVARPGRDSARVLELPFAASDLSNTSLPAPQLPMRRALRDLCAMPRMSTLGVAGLVNHAVGRMPGEEAFVNVGVWHGFTVLAGMTGNPDKKCVGIDDFSEFGGPREHFERRFEALKGPAHSFHEMDYRRYFQEIHREPIGVYLYDGHHDYEHQRQGLEIAEPFFGDRCVVLVDDTNWQAARDATIDFVAESEREYDLLFDRATADHPHPTLWNGLMVLEATGAARTKPPDAVRSEFAEREPAARFPGRPSPLEGVEGEPLVSIVLVDFEGSAQSHSAAVDACTAQTWPRTEVLVVDRDSIPAGVPDALARANGELVAVADTSAPLRANAVEVALRFPEAMRFEPRLTEAKFSELEQALPST